VRRRYGSVSERQVEPEEQQDRTGWPLPSTDVPNHALAALLPQLAEAQTAHGMAALTTARQSGDVNRVLLVARQAAGSVADAPAAVLPPVTELAARIVQCIGTWETNRGGTEPHPTESRLDTVAGIKASMATVEQATMPYAIDVLRRNPGLWAQADPPLTRAELTAAEKRCRAVDHLLGAVGKAAAEGTAVEDFRDDHQDDIAATGLTDDDVATMFEAVGLKARIDAAHAAYEAAPKRKRSKALKDEVSGIPEQDRLGIDDASLRTYVRNPRTWGENAAAWKRKAVDAMPDDVGARINAVATSDSGTALAEPMYARRVEAALRAHPDTTEQALVTSVGQLNNPHEAQYGANIWATYQRLYPPASD
jgi:hypothetical protein